VEHDLHHELVSIRVEPPRGERAQGGTGAVVAKELGAVPGREVEPVVLRKQQSHAGRGEPGVEAHQLRPPQGDRDEVGRPPLHDADLDPPEGGRLSPDRHTDRGFDGHEGQSGRHGWGTAGVHRPPL